MVSVDTEKIVEMVSVYVDTPSDTLVNGAVDNATQTALQSLRTAGYDETSLDGYTEDTYRVAIEFYAIADLIRALYNANDSSGEEQVRYYMERGDRLIRELISELDEGSLNPETSPISATKTDYKYNTRY